MEIAGGAMLGYWDDRQGQDRQHPGEHDDDGDDPGEDGSIDEETGHGRASTSPSAPTTITWALPRGIAGHRRVRHQDGIGLHPCGRRARTYMPGSSSPLGLGKPHAA
jgi:hypothetical protein